MEYHGFSIQMFLPDGDPDGVRIVSMSRRTLRVLVCSRSKLGAITQRPELAYTGVYILTGPNEEPPPARSIYVGEAECVGLRIRNHATERDFWTDVVVVTTIDDSLNKAHVRYLEARLIDTARSAQRSSLENSTTPSPEPLLSEAERHDMEDLLRDLRLIFPIVGIHDFEPREQPDAPTLRFRSANCEAEGQQTTDGFLVFAGARVRPEAVQSTRESTRRIRDELLNAELLVEEGDMWILKDDHVFTSASAAANVISGTNINGKEMWKDDRGRSLNDLEREAGT